MRGLSGDEFGNSGWSKTVTEIAVNDAPVAADDPDYEVSGGPTLNVPGTGRPRQRSRGRRQSADVETALQRDQRAGPRHLDLERQWVVHLHAHRRGSSVTTTSPMSPTTARGAATRASR